MTRRWAVGSLLIAGALGAGAVLVRGTVPRAEDPRVLPRDRGRPILYVALGDSTVAGVGASGPERSYVSVLHGRLRGVYAGARVVNLGVSGATAADVVQGQLTRAVGLRPDLVTLSIGPNDITGRRSLADYESNVETILRTLARQTTAVLVVNLIPDLGVTPRFRRGDLAPVVGRQAALFNEALHRQARHHGAVVVDLYARSREEVPRRPELVAADGYHPSDQGYARWAELVWEGVRLRIH